MKRNINKLVCIVFLWLIYKYVVNSYLFLFLFFIFIFMNIFLQWMKELLMNEEITSASFIIPTDVQHLVIMRNNNNI